MSVWKKYSYGWVTLCFFLISVAGHLGFGAWAYIGEHGAEGGWVSSFLIEWARDTLENWQSEFLQLIWQIGGLAFLLYVGSSQSKNESDRVERKIDRILRMVDKSQSNDFIRNVDEEYHRSD